MKIRLFPLDRCEERVYPAPTNPELLGEDPDGGLWLVRGIFVGKRFNPWNPTHWPAWYRTRKTGTMIWLE